MHKLIAPFLIGFLSFSSIAQQKEALPVTSVNTNKGQTTAMAVPANDNCASATNLTVGSSLLCSQAAANATSQTGECLANWAGGSNSTMWYKFQATNDSLVLNWIETASGSVVLRVYGPFAPGSGCLPACASAIYNQQLAGDPGSHILLTGLTTATNNNQYWIQADVFQANGPGTTGYQFCVNLQNPAANAYASGATQISACGTSFGGTSNGGYWNNGAGTTTGYANLDNNAGTTCSGCTSGNDTPFVINNVSWFQFCSGTSGTWQITVNGISGCTLAAPNQGIQASVFTGATTALSNQGNSPSPIAPGSSWTSGIITVNAGACAWLMIDGFAGDACNYNVTLTNVSGGCIVLPIELVNFTAHKADRQNVLEWVTRSEKNNERFIIEKSSDGTNWVVLTEIPSAGSGQTTRSYVTYDDAPKSIINYYRLKQVDSDGLFEYFKTVSVDNRFGTAPKIDAVYDIIGNYYGKSIPSSQQGIFLIKYDDGSVIKQVVQ